MRAMDNFDVLISYEDVDAAAALTCVAAFEREGWSVFPSSDIESHGAPARQIRARAYVVIWSETSVSSLRLARENLKPLEDSRLLQLLLQPKDSHTRYGENVIEPPDPFCFYQGLPVVTHDVDGSDDAIDRFAHSWSTGHEILAEVARLGKLTRPSDSWNTKVRFSKPLFGSVEPVIVSEYSPADGRLLRRDRIGANSLIDNDYETTIGNIWRVVTQRQGELVTELQVTGDEHEVILPQRRRWWQGRGRG